MLVRGEELFWGVLSLLKKKKRKRVKFDYKEKREKIKYHRTRELA
jgi:hypothetical protein